ncbi:MAG: transporter substrate-binding domain-containing protein [Dechloromonas sp.]|nr:MAG: transporter substrate-binding domain-containing protein [Dechloromonas sp.]
MAGAVTAAEQALRVAVLENSPPMSYRDADGRLTGFSAEIIRAVCAEMQVRCELQPIVLERVLDALGSGEIDIAAVSLLDTPERRARILFATPYFRSTSCGSPNPACSPATAASAWPPSRVRHRSAMRAARAGIPSPCRPTANSASPCWPASRRPRSFP